MKQEMRECIRDVAAELNNGCLMQAALAGANFYAATENLLRAYKKLKRQAESAEDYQFEPPKRDKSITVAPPTGGAGLDWDEVRDDAIRERMRAFVRSSVQFSNIDNVVKMFEKNPHFVIIRMFYFGEDINGNDVTHEGEKRTIEDISYELEEAGFEYGRSRKTVAKKKTELVRDMTVVLFGEAGALSIELHKARKAAEQ